MRAIILTGGGPPPASVAAHLPVGAMVLAADSGFDSAGVLELRVDVLIGDLDSISASGLDLATKTEVPIERFATEKDHTDLELAIRAAIERGATALTVVGGGGGRLDHQMAELALLSSRAYATVSIEAWLGTAYVRPLHGPAQVDVAGRVGEVVTLLAVHEPAAGITTAGLRYPLHRESLRPGDTRGVSNQLLETSAMVSFDRGTLVIIRPNALGDRV